MDHCQVLLAGGGVRRFPEPGGRNGDFICAAHGPSRSLGPNCRLPHRDRCALFHRRQLR
ncbi:hypothetical protein BURKHO8Y_40021 [Burkholderia sp. 8Y]|nr:hypothetical protein BURKHO8Y_40021 [Burkholderia sp. 8Y]